jgi:hypothetical protein
MTPALRREAGPVVQRWATRAALVGLLILFFGTIWRWNRSVDETVTAVMLGLGAVLLLGGVGEKPVPFPMREVPQHWSPWRRRLIVWLYLVGLVSAAVSIPFALGLVVDVGVFLTMFAGGLVATGASMWLMGDAGTLQPHGDGSGEYTSLPETGDGDGGGGGG